MIVKTTHAQGRCPNCGKRINIQLKHIKIAACAGTEVSFEFVCDACGQIGWEHYSLEYIKTFYEG